jgi:hypothetical protein
MKLINQEKDEKVRRTRFAVWSRALALIVLVSGLAIITIGPHLSLAAGPATIQAAPAMPVTPMRPPVKYFPTGGPYVAENDALAAAAALARGPVARQEIHRLSYAQVSAFLGNRNYEYDDAREMYVILSSGSWQTRGSVFGAPKPCGSFFSVFDATSGRPVAVGCGGPGPWPSRVPLGFATE